MTQNHPNYPTKEEILENLYVPTDKEKEAVIQWKKEYYKGLWGKMSSKEKGYGLKILIHRLCNAQGRVHPLWAEGSVWSYSEKKVITYSLEKMSIVSALHELGHHLYRASELEACRYSIGIFSVCFPRAYARLDWEGHLLVKR